MGRMDAERQLRWVIPPFFLLGSLALRAGIDPDIDVLELLNDADGETLAALGAIVIAFSIPVGFAISAISRLVMHFRAWMKCWPTWEVQLPLSATQKVFKAVGHEFQPRKLLYAVATFDHELAHER